MELLNRRREMGSHLPYDAEVEYIETKNSSQFIDTGIYASKDLSFYVDWENQNAGGNPYGNAFGDSTSGGYRVSKAYGGMVIIKGQFTNQGFGTAGRHVVSYDGEGHIYVDGSLVKTFTPSDFTPNFTIILFGARNNRTGSMQQGMGNNRMYRCTFGNVADFIPVRKGTEGYMYDTVRQQLFAATNGTTFTAGPDKT
jgi:hypothetical protein